MSNPEEARAAQLRNIEARTGKSLADLCAAVADAGKVKHAEVRAWAMQTYGLGYGDANGLAAAALAGASATGAPTATIEDALDGIYIGKKAHLRGIHDAVMAALPPGNDYEVAPKNGYVSLRRKKQFAMLGPKTNDRAELGINLKDDVASDRILAQKPGGMCRYTIALRRPEDVDGEVVGVLKAAFDAAG